MHTVPSFTKLSDLPDLQPPLIHFQSSNFKYSRYNKTLRFETVNT
jgi:hypothetical protein